MRMSQSSVINPEERVAEPEHQVPNFMVYLEHLGHLLKKKKSDSVGLWQGQESIFKSFLGDSDNRSS